MCNSCVSWIIVIPISIATRSGHSSSNGGHFHGRVLGETLLCFLINLRVVTNDV